MKIELIPNWKQVLWKSYTAWSARLITTCTALLAYISTNPHGFVPDHYIAYAQQILVTIIFVIGLLQPWLRNIKQVSLEPSD